MANIGIIGWGFVGKATQYGFDKTGNQLFIIDPLLGTSVSDLKDKKIDAAFICVPTPMGKDGSIDVSIVQSVMEELVKLDVPLIVLKSTVTPDLVGQFAEQYSNFVYNPEFLTEANAKNDFANPFVQVFGGNPDKTKQLEEIYAKYSICAPCPVKHMTAKEASFVKYSINSFLATKVVFWNQMKELVESHGCNYDAVRSGFTSDPRIGTSHSMVPGPDGRFGTGSSCFSKDVPALVQFSNKKLSVLRETWNTNVDLRNQYDTLLPREVEQHVEFNKI